MPDPEHELIATVRRYNARAQALQQATDVRDEAIRRAVQAKVRRDRIAEITGLSRQRVDQIRRGSRI